MKRGLIKLTPYEANTVLSILGKNVSDNLKSDFPSNDVEVQVSEDDLERVLDLLDTDDNNSIILREKINHRLLDLRK